MYMVSSVSFSYAFHFYSVLDSPARHFRFPFLDTALSSIPTATFLLLFVFVPDVVHLATIQFFFFSPDTGLNCIRRRAVCRCQHLKSFVSFSFSFYSLFARRVHCVLSSSLLPINTPASGPSKVRQPLRFVVCVLVSFDSLVSSRLLDGQLVLSFPSAFVSCLRPARFPLRGDGLGFLGRSGRR